MHLFLRFVIASFAFVHLLLAEDEIRVELTTRSSLSPIYLCRIHTNCESPYLKNLRAVFAFDLNHSGFSKVAPCDETLEKVLQHKDPHVAFNASRWMKAGVSAVLRLVAEDNQLDLFVFNVQVGKLQKFEGITLSGSLDQDRRKIHKLCDATLKTLFGVEGVSSLQVLYSVQFENDDPSSNEWKGEIFECDFDGENARQVTYEQSYSITPMVIPEHSIYEKNRYLYVNYKNGQPKIYFSSLKNRTGKPLLNLRGNQLLPTMSRKRDKLAFISDASGRADLFVQTLEENGQLIGKPKQLFSYPRSTQASPTFSPDGEKIAFVSDKDGTPRIYLIPSAIKGDKRPIPTLLTKRNRENTCPSWSPDGTKLAYSAKTNGIRQIWLYDFETEEEEQLTTGPGNKENPSWAPNSVHLIFNSTDPGSSELFLVNLHQSEAVKITKGAGKKHYPTWGTR